LHRSPIAPLSYCTAFLVYRSSALSLFRSVPISPPWSLTAYCSAELFVGLSSTILSLIWINRGRSPDSFFQNEIVLILSVKGVLRESSVFSPTAKKQSAAPIRLTRRSPAHRRLPGHPPAANYRPWLSGYCGTVESGTWGEFSFFDFLGFLGPS